MQGPVLAQRRCRRVSQRRWPAVPADAYSAEGFKAAVIIIVAQPGAGAFGRPRPGPGTWAFIADMLAALPSEAKGRPYENPLEAVLDPARLQPRPARGADGHQPARDEPDGAISEDVGQNLTRIADSVLKLTAEKSGEILAKNAKAAAFALMWLTREAESARRRHRWLRRSIFHISMTRRPLPRISGPTRTTGGVLPWPPGHPWREFAHPVFCWPRGIFDPGQRGCRPVVRPDRCVSGSPATSRKTLHWVYISLEDSLHVSFPATAATGRL
jgi:hypothetical protein